MFISLGCTRVSNPRNSYYNTTIDGDTTIIEITYADISLDEFAIRLSSSMSSVQKEDLIKTYKKQYFNGTGILYDIQKDPWSSQKIIYLVSLVDNSLIYEVYVEPQEYEKIKNNAIGSPISFSAQLQYKSGFVNSLIFYDGIIMNN